MTSPPEEKIEAGPRPAWFNVRAVKLVLDGAVHALGRAFDWYRSPQGHQFWSDCRVTGLTPEARSILETWLAEEKENG